MLGKNPNKAYEDIDVEDFFCKCDLLKKFQSYELMYFCFKVSVDKVCEKLYERICTHKVFQCKF